MIAAGVTPPKVVVAKTQQILLVPVRYRRAVALSRTFMAWDRLHAGVVLPQAILQVDGASMVRVPCAVLSRRSFRQHAVRVNAMRTVEAH